jgi:hypothetical protein
VQRGHGTIYETYAAQFEQCIGLRLLISHVPSGSIVGAIACHAAARLA